MKYQLLFGFVIARALRPKQSHSPDRIASPQSGLAMTMPYGNPNRNKHYWIFFLLGIMSIVNFSCRKKEYPAPSTGNPVFYFDGTINGNPMNIKAGINDYYMYSSFVQDVNRVYNFQGDLKDLLF